MIKMKKTFQEGLDLKWAGKFEEALEKFKKCIEYLDEHLDPDVLFNIGVCQWKIGNLAEAKESFEAVLSINGKDRDAEAILGRIKRTKTMPIALPPSLKTLHENTIYQFPDFRKDGAIVDANFLIRFWDNDSKHFIKFVTKARKRYNLYTTARVHREMTQIGKESKLELAKVQGLLFKSLILVPILDSDITTLESQILGEFSKTKEIKDSHKERYYAWRNDLSLVCLLSLVKNPIKYVVTDDGGLQEIIQFIYSHLDSHYYIRSNTVFKLSVEQLCEFNTRQVWETNLYENNQ